MSTASAITVRGLTKSFGEVRAVRGVDFEVAAGEDALSELGPVIMGLGKAAWQVASVGDEQQRSRAVELLAETRRALYRILAEEPEGDDGDSDPETGDEPSES